MNRFDKISHFLPINFANGNTIRGFSKLCPHCQTVVEAENMVGLLSKQQERVFLSAQARCPHCHTNFSISCVITNDKRVHRVGLPHWLFRLWLQYISRHDVRSPSPRHWKVDAPSSLSSQDNEKSKTRTEVTCSEEILGQFEGQTIPAWVEYEGVRFNFDHVAPQRLLLNTDELLLENKLVYKSI